MRYISEKMKEILSSSTAQRMMDYVSPVYEDAYTALHLFNSIGLELDDIVQWCAEYVEQVVPKRQPGRCPIMNRNMVCRLIPRILQNGVKLCW